MMSEQPCQPDDPAFWASRALDGDLSPEEQKRIEEALAASAELRAEVEQLRTVDGLVKRWGRDRAELDWATYTKLVHAQIEAGEENLDTVDRLLERWGSEPVEFDEGAFTGAVMAAVRSEQRRTPRRNLIFRIGAPLAAAAAVAIAVSGWFWARAPRDAGGPDVVPSQRLVVLFDRTPVAEITDMVEAPGISLIAMGASPMTEGIEEAPPL